MPDPMSSRNPKTPAIDRRELFGLGGAWLAGGVAGSLFSREALALTEAPPVTLDGARRGGTLDAVVHPEPPTLAFFINTATPTRAVVSKIFDGLVEYGPDLTPRPQLAERWETSADGLTWTFTLRKGVVWHDGTPFTSADVRFSAEIIWKRYAPTAKRIFQHLTKVEAPDAHTVILTLAKPTPVIVNALDVVAAPILPRHLYEGTDIPNNPHNNNPSAPGRSRSGMGARQPHPPRTLRQVLAARAALPGRHRLEDHPGRVGPGQRPGNRGGEIRRANPVTFADADRLARSDKLVVSKEGYNGFAGWLWLIPNLRHPVIGKPKVRQAILHAINRDLLVKTVWGGYAVPATGPVSSLLKTFYTAETPQYPFDRRKAEALLDEAGYPKQADGWRFKLNHDFIPFGDDYRRTGEFVRQSLRAVGIDVTLRALDLAAWTKNVFTDYNFDLVSSWGVNWQDPQIGVEQHYWSKAEAKGTPWFNASGYASPEADRLLEAAQSETDPTRRVAIYRDFQKLAQTDLPLLNILEFRWFGVWDARLRNVTDTFNHSQSNFAQVWFEQSV